MKQKLTFISALISGIVLFSIVSCQNTQKKNNTKERTALADTATFQPGTVYDSVHCFRYPEASYVLYLPKEYNSLKKFPVIFFFDAHARGWLPVKKYKALADSFGFILVASNDSKNGQSSQIRNRIIYHFMQDVEQRFAIDPARIYTGGFSGGARIAAGIGLSNKNIAGVIGCAAGFPRLNHITNTHLAYVGIVGNTDFNYLEMKQLNNELTAAHWSHYLLIFNGHHQWPPLQTMQTAFDFLQTNAMRRQLIPVDKQLITHLQKHLEQKRKQAIQNQNPLLQRQIDWQLVAFLNGLIPVGSYKKEIEELQQNSKLKRQEQQETLLKQEEQKWQQTYARALESKDAGWWRNTLAQLSERQRKAKTPPGKLMVRRLYNYLSLMAYLYTDGSLKNDQTAAAGKFLMIYEKADPTNPEVYFLKAQLYAMTGNRKAIIPSLQKAADNGFKDTKRMEKNARFSGLHQTDSFRKILLQVEENKKAAESD